MLLVNSRHADPTPSPWRLVSGASTRGRRNSMALCDARMTFRSNGPQQESISELQKVSGVDTAGAVEIECGVVRTKKSRHKLHEVLVVDVPVAVEVAEETEDPGQRIWRRRGGEDVVVAAG